MLKIFNTEEGSQRGTEQNIHRQTERKIVYINLSVSKIILSVHELNTLTKSQSSSTWL